MDDARLDVVLSAGDWTSLDTVPNGMKFRVLAARLRDQIGSGRLPVGTRLPTERELSRVHKVGLNTVRRAVGLLAEEGLVQRRQGAGTFVQAEAGIDRRDARFVGVVVPLMSGLYPGIVEGIERVMTAANVRVILANSQYDTELEAQLQRQLLDDGAEGLLLVPNLHRMGDPLGYLNQLGQLPVPWVLVERQSPHPAPDDHTSYVCTNHAGGTYAMIRHLVGLGHRRIGHLGRLRTATADAIAAGFHVAVDAFDLPAVPAAIVRHETWSDDELAAYVNICVEHEISAVFSLGDRDAARLLPHLRRRGLLVPDDIAVGCYDDEIADLVEVPLTTITRPQAEIGRLAAETLLHRMDTDPTGAHQVQLQPNLSVRASCGAGSVRTRSAAVTPAAPRGV